MKKCKLAVGQLSDCLQDTSFSHFTPQLGPLARSDLGLKWVTLVNRTNPRLFRSDFSAFWLVEQNVLKSELKKILDLGPKSGNPKANCDSRSVLKCA